MTDAAFEQFRLGWRAARPAASLSSTTPQPFVFLPTTTASSTCSLTLQESEGAKHVDSHGPPSPDPLPTAWDENRRVDLPRGDNRRMTPTTGVHAAPPSLYSQSSGQSLPDKHQASRQTSPFRHIPRQASPPHTNNLEGQCGLPGTAFSYARSLSRLERHHDRSFKTDLSQNTENQSKPQQLPTPSGASTMSSFPSLTNRNVKTFPAAEPSMLPPTTANGSSFRARLHCLNQRRRSEKSFSFPSDVRPSAPSAHTPPPNDQLPEQFNEASSFHKETGASQSPMERYLEMCNNVEAPVAPPKQQQQQSLVHPQQQPQQQKQQQQQQQSLSDDSTSSRNFDDHSQLPNVPLRGTSTTRTKLVDLQAKIATFEAQLQAESQQRRAAEERRLNTLGEGMCSLEKTLNAEVRRRLEANKTIQMGFETQLATLESRIERSLDEKEQHIAAAVEALTNRIRDAETEVTAVQEAHATAIQKVRAEVERTTEAIATTKSHLENELKARRQREAAMFDKMADIEKQIEARLALEKGIRQKDVEQLNLSLDAVNNNHVALDEAFQKSLAAGFHELKAALEAETQARERSDDDIVQALNHYTIALQTALKIANAG